MRPTPLRSSSGDKNLPHCACDCDCDCACSAQLRGRQETRLQLFGRTSRAHSPKPRCTKLGVTHQKHQPVRPHRRLLLRGVGACLQPQQGMVIQCERAEMTTTHRGPRNTHPANAHVLNNTLSAAVPRTPCYSDCAQAHLCLTKVPLRDDCEGCWEDCGSWEDCDLRGGIQSWRLEPSTSTIHVNTSLQLERRRFRIDALRIPEFTANPNFSSCGRGPPENDGVNNIRNEAADVVCIRKNRTVPMLFAPDAPPACSIRILFLPRKSCLPAPANPLATPPPAGGLTASACGLMP